MRRFATVLAMLHLPIAAAAQGAGNPPGCTMAEHRQFDFWVGDWNVTAQGNQAGTNAVTLEEQGCLVHEHWVGSRGGTGQSFNFYDRVAGKWFQVWVDSGGNSLQLTGSYADGQMRLAGTAAGPDGKSQAQRLTFFRNGDGTVRQLWETSDDQGTTWQVAFDGLYRKAP
jgi:hypothetical protein